MLTVAQLAPLRVAAPARRSSPRRVVVAQAAPKKGEAKPVRTPPGRGASSAFTAVLASTAGAGARVSRFAAARPTPRPEPMKASCARPHRRDQRGRGASCAWPCAVSPGRDEGYPFTAQLDAPLTRACCQDFMTWLISGFNPSWVLKDSGEYAGYGAQGGARERSWLETLTLATSPLEDVLKSGKELPKTKPAAKPVRTAAADWGSFTHCPSIQSQPLTLPPRYCPGWRDGQDVRSEV